MDNTVANLTLRRRVSIDSSNKVLDESEKKIVKDDLTKVGCIN
jgi:hypothetical protein